MKKILILFLFCFISILTKAQHVKRVDSVVKVIVIPKVKKDTIITAKKETKIDSFVNQWKGRPYVYGGMNIKGIDCSAFAQKFYQDIFNMSIPRTAYTQYSKSTKVSKKEITTGDLIFFISSASPSGWHVAVYLGNNIIMHAANRRVGVIVEELNESIIKRIYSVGRYIQND